MLEQFAGVLVIVLVVSRLIGPATSRAIARRDAEDCAGLSRRVAVLPA